MSRLRGLLYPKEQCPGWVYAAPPVIGILNGFDRVRIRGTLRRLCYVDRFGKYLSAMKVRLKDFKPYAEGITDRVRRATEGMAEEAGRPRQYLGSPSTSQEEVPPGDSPK